MSLARPRPALIPALVVLGAIAMTALAGWRSVSVFAQARTGLRITQDVKAGTITVHRAGRAAAIVTQNAPADARPYIHPIAAPDGKGVLTEFSPEHHKHQTGLYWGFTRLNGRDYFHNRQGDYWRRVSATVTQASGDQVRWQTVYDLLDDAGDTVLTETQRWSVREDRGRFLLDLEWRGLARVDVTIGKYDPSTGSGSSPAEARDDYGGLFLRMPWKPGMPAEVVNAARQRNARAEGQRAMWVDVAMQVEGRDDSVHVALFDHPDNAGYPLPWRVDDQFGVGTARARNADWTIKKGDVEVIRHRLVAYAGTLDDVALTAAWSEYSGHRSTYATQALWGIAQREGREEKFLTPEQAAAAMTMVPGYAVKAWAGEPMIQQPMAFCWDDRGRLWVAENLDYETRGRGFSKAGNSRILILEDTDHDGVADSRKVFMEGIVFPSALAVGFDGVFVGAPPNLLFVPDRDNDDKADVDKIEVRLTGWGIRDRHEVLNSLHWGPDGWLYGLQGFATPSKIRKPVGTGRIYKQGEAFPEDILEGEGVEINGGVWRYHPTKDRFEVVAHGFSNPWGIDYDAKGQLVMSACVIPHLWHVIPGGIYQRQGGQHFNPYVYGDIQTIADHRHRSAHGGARVYQSDAFPASQQGRVFMANIHEHAVLSDVLERKGSGFTAHHGDDFLMANNAQWVGFSMEVGPDGALYVLDWHDADICGADVQHHETGRIFRIAPTPSLAEQWPGRYSDLRTMPDTALVALQTSRSDWHARRARVILQGRAAKGSLSAEARAGLMTMFQTVENPDWRLRAMWALHVTGGWSTESLEKTLVDRDEYIRAWAIQLLTEDGTPSAEAIARFGGMARDERSAVVRLYLAAALQRLDHAARWPIAAGLLAHGEDATDQNLPNLLWLGVEPLVPENAALALERTGQGNIPTLARYAARRAVDADALAPIVAELGKSPKMMTSLLEGMRDGLEGRVDLVPPPAWPSTLAQLKRSPDARIPRLASEVARQFGDTETARRNLAVAGSGTAAIDERRRAIQVLAAQRKPELIRELPALFDEEPLRIDAIRAIAAFDDEGLGTLLVARFSSLDNAEKAEAAQTFAARGRYGRMLTDALAANEIDKRDIPPYVARQLRRVVGVRFAEVWGPLEADTSEERSYSRYRGVLNDNAMAGANAVTGRGVFQRTCAPCHRMFGEGGAIGPELTGSNRANLEYLLSNVLSPNAEIQDAYKVVVITTRDGRTFSGNLAAENDRQVTLRLVGRDPIAINKADIQSRETTATSMMPTGLFDALTEREVIDLVGYLRTTEQVKAPPQR